MSKILEISDGTKVLHHDLQINPQDYTLVKLPNSLEEIGSRAFDGFNSLTEIIIPPSVKKIGEEAFFGCTSLKQITLPASVETIEPGAFSCCHIEIDSQSPFFKFYKGALYDLKKGSLIYYNDNFGEKFNQFSPIDSLVEIADKAFWATKIKEIRIPSTVKRIGNKAFWNCNELYKVDLFFVEIIGSDAFYPCNSLNLIELPKSIKELGVNWCGWRIYLIVAPDEIKNKVIESVNRHPGKLYIASPSEYYGSDDENPYLNPFIGNLS